MAAAYLFGHTCIHQAARVAVGQNGLPTGCEGWVGSTGVVVIIMPLAADEASCCNESGDCCFLRGKTKPGCMGERYAGRGEGAPLAMWNSCCCGCSGTSGGGCMPGTCGMTEIGNKESVGEDECACETCAVMSKGEWQCMCMSGRILGGRRKGRAVREGGVKGDGRAGASSNGQRRRQVTSECERKHVKNENNEKFSNYTVPSHSPKL
jgi:hypothetical protein